MKLWLTVAVALIVATPVQAQDKAKLSGQAKRLLAMTPDQMQPLIEVKDDSLETVATISSKPVFQEKQGLLGVVWNDNFLRAFIDKKTGNVTFQLYQFINYQGDWRFYNSANYETPDGPVSTEVTEIGRDVVSCSGSLYGSGCKLSEHVGFNVPEPLLRQIAARYVPGEAVAWRFKFKAKAGPDFPDGMVAAEVVAFLKVVDAYKAAHPGK